MKLFVAVFLISSSAFAQQQSLYGSVKARIAQSYRSFMTYEADEAFLHREG